MWGVSHSGQTNYSLEWNETYEFDVPRTLITVPSRYGKCRQGRRHPWVPCCACADGGQLESVNPSVGSDKPCVPCRAVCQIVSLPTPVLNPIVVFKLWNDMTTCHLLTFLTKTNYCVLCALFLAVAARRLDLLCIK